MELADIAAMTHKLEQMTRNIIEVSDEDWEENSRILADLAARDPSVRL